jgi:Predicted membrane protein (DUF2157)
MRTERYLDQWRTDGTISGAQHAALSALVRKERFSVYLELNALLYLGVLAFAAGLGWTVRDHFARFGDVAVLVTLAAIFAASLFYCFTRTPPYSASRVEAPTFAFDYVLYLGCLTFAVALGYIEYRFHVLQASWDVYLLASAILYLTLAYRFDNRFVLSLSLSTLAGWFGVRLSTWDVLPSTMRAAAVAYGGVVAAIGLWSHRLHVKTHFRETYMHVAANAVLLALTSGAVAARDEWWWLFALVAVAACSVAFGIRLRLFAFIVYGVAYAYVGFTAQVVETLRDATAVLTYFVVSGLIVVGALVVVSRRVGRET